MKVHCSLSDTQVEKLYTAVYKEMLKAVQEGKAFEPTVFMKNLFKQIEEKKDVNVASTFLQIVPTLMSEAYDQEGLEELKFDLNKNKTLVNKFRNSDNGLLETLKYFKPGSTLKDLLINVELQSSILNTPTGGSSNELDELLSDPFRWMTDDAFTSTMQELEQQDPNAITKKEEKDPNKFRIYRAIRRLRREGTKATALSDLMFQGKAVKLKTVLLSSFGAGETLDKTTAAHLLRSNSMLKDGTHLPEVTPAKDIVVLVVSDEFGNTLYFDEEGSITTKEKGGLPVYQFLRDVRKDTKTGKLRVTDIYGIEDRILSPEEIIEKAAHKMDMGIESYKKWLIAQGTTYEKLLESIDKQQQEEFKDLQKLRDEVRAGNNKLLSIDGISNGVVDIFTENKTVTLNMLLDEYQIPKNNLNIQILPENSRAAIYAGEQYYIIDRPNLKEEYIKQIAAVLLDPSLSNKQKMDFYDQFTSNSINTQVRKLFVNYNAETDALTILYRTNPKVEKRTVQLDITDPGAEQIIIDSLLKEAIIEDENGVRTYATNMNFNDALLNNSKTFYLYDTTTKELVDTSYNNFLLNLNLKIVTPKKDKKADDGKNYNPYFKFQVQSDLADVIAEVKEQIKQQAADPRSNIRKAKDALVDNLITKPSLSGRIVTGLGGVGTRFIIKAGNITAEGRFQKGITSNDVTINEPVTFIVTDEIADNKLYRNVISIYNADGKKIGQVSETDYDAGEKPRTPETIKEEATKADKEFTAPTDTNLPDDISDISDMLNLSRSSKLPNNVTEEEIKAAQEWWNNSPLSKLIKLEHMANIVNSDVYARFIIAGKRLEDTSIQLDTATGSSAVDLYHEAWHAFSQLFLTKAQKTKLYAETRKRLNNYDLSSLEVEEILAEEYRDYAKDPAPKSDAPVRNTIFRKIWNFIKTLFGKRSIKEDLFERLYFAGKNPKLLNKYTPLVDNAMFNKLNRARGIMNAETKELALNYQDSMKVSNQLDSALSLFIDKVHDNRAAKRAKNVRDSIGNLVKANKSGTIEILADDRNRNLAYGWVGEQFKIKLDAFKSELDNTPEEDFNKRAVLNNKIRIIEQALNNWDNSIAFHKEHSTFDLIKQKYIEISNEEADIDEDTTAPENVDSTEAISKSEVGQKSLLELAEKETLYILKSLFKIVDGKQVTGPLGFPELADFSKTWNIVTKVIGGEKDPIKMYQKLVNAAGINSTDKNAENREVLYPELIQLVNSKFPDPTNIDNISEFNIKAAFWQDFKKTQVRYVQLTVDEDGETGGYKSEVTDASIEFKNIINRFKSNFNSSPATDYITKTEDNKSVLNIERVIKDFPSISTPKLQIEFARTLGIDLQDLKSIKDELAQNQKKYGIPYLYGITQSVSKLIKDPNATEEQKKFIDKFLANPVEALYGKIPSGIYPNAESEKRVLQNLAKLQSKFGTDYASFSVLNAEKNLVNEFVEDSTVTMIVNAINTVDNGRDLWLDPSFKYMRYLNPMINGFTEQSQLLKSIFQVRENTWDRKKDGKIDFVMVSGTQLVSTNEGANTTSLDVHSKYIQELNMMLKSGFQEFMRHASKSSSFGMKSSKILNLYVDIDEFRPGGNADKYAVDNIFLGYIQAELMRIQKIRANKEEYKKYVGYNREIKNSDDEVIGMAGEFFTAFDTILTEDTKNEIIDKVKNGNLIEYLKSDPKLKEDITEQVTDYFNSQTVQNKKDFQKAKWIDPALTNKLKVYDLTSDEEETTLIKAHTMNAWIHNFETASLVYGDIVQYNHAKQELHKRNPGSTSGGRGFMTDLDTQNFINSDLIKGTSYGAKLANLAEFGSDYATFNYTGEFNTAIAQDVKRKSVYIKHIEKALRDDYSKRNLTQAEIDYKLKKELKPYNEMEEGDGQGFITIDAYRTLRLVEKNWSDDQEKLFQDIINNKPINAEDITKFFPVYKLQHFGHIANTSLPVNSMHKFALMPLIPSVIKGSDLESLHHQMMKSNIQYFTFQTGSKVGSVTSQLDKDGKAVADQIYDDKGVQKSIKKDIQFTPNTIYLEYLKNVTAVPDKYKGKTVFATQLRKLILEGLYENGKIVENYKKYAPQIKAYEDAVNNYTEILKKELLEEIGYEKVNGKYVSGDLSKFMDLIQRELERKDIPEHLIDYIQLGENNTITKDLSLHMLSGDIEKMITSLVEKRIVKQKVKGEALVQVASSMSNGLWDSGFKFDKAQTEEIEKYLGTNNLPFYYPGKDGKTTAMKVAIALQGDFVNLLKLKDNDGKVIGTRERLNQMIKDDKWLDTGNNRKAVTMTAVRIPVQGLNSMEFMEVYEFLDPAAGNIIIPPTEIVAKSGADYDVDKLTTFMPNIDARGQYVESGMDTEALDRVIAASKKKGDKAEMKRLIKLQKAALENKLIDSIRGLLELPDTYATLVRPNETYLMKDTADKLVELLPEYSRYKTISPTNVFEVGYNLHKHEANMIGKDVLGIIAIDNALNPLFTSLGADLPKTYKGLIKNKKTKKYEEDPSVDYDMRLLLKHNTTDQGNISLSGINTADGKDKIADLISHLMNGSVDVEKDAWIFFIQANKEIIPTLLNLLKAGVPTETAIYFVSQPLVKEYARQQRLYDSTYAELIGKSTGTDESKKYNALLATLRQTDISNTVHAANKNRLNKVLSETNPDTEISLKINGKKEPLKTTIKSLNSNIKNGKLDLLNVEAIYADKGALFKSIIADPDNEFYHPLSNANYKDVAVAGTKNIKQFDLQDLKDLVTKNDKYSPTAVAAFLHYIEFEKQIKSVADLKKQSNPDTTTSKTVQELLQKKLGLDLLSESSKLNPELVSKLRKQSILGSFFDNSLTPDLVEPIFPLTDDKRVTEYLLDYLKNNTVPAKFGEGADGVTNFITSFKNAMVNFIYQNKLNQIISNGESFPGIPDSMTSLDHQAYVAKFMQMLGENSHLKDLYSVLEQITDVPVNIFDAKTKKFKEQQFVLTLNNKAVVKGELASAYHQNLIDLADENIMKVKDPVKNKEISDMFKMLPLMSILQNGVGNTKYGLSYILPDTTYFEIVEPASRKFVQNGMNTKVFDMIRSMMMANDPNVNNYIVGPVASRPTQASATDNITIGKGRIDVEIGPDTHFYEILNNAGKQLGEIGVTYPSWVKEGEQPNASDFKSNKVFISQVYLKDEFKGKGLGKEAYIKFASDLQSRGFEVSSGINTSESAKRVWESLVNDGYAYKNNDGYIFKATTQQQGVATNASEYTNHSGGAIGSDTQWDVIGKEFGIINNRHYFTGEKGPKNAPLGNVDITDQPIAVEGASKVAQAAKQMWGYKYNTMKDQRLIRNWAQVANSDAVFAIGTLGKEGDIWKGDEKSAEPRKLLKVAVQGGTGYAVEMAIQAGKPVYVFDQVRNQWYKNINGEWSKSEVPTLTKNFAGIGTREINEAGKQAIKDVYANTFKAATQPSTITDEVTYYQFEANKPYQEIGNINKLTPVTKEVFERFKNNFNTDNYDEFMLKVKEIQDKDTDADIQMGPGFPTIDETSKDNGKTWQFTMLRGREFLDDYYQSRIDKGWAKKIKFNELPTQPSTSVKIISEDYGVVQAETNPTKEFDQKIANAIFEDVRDNAYVENGSNTAQRMWGNGLMWKGNNTKKPTGIPLKVIPAKVDNNANGKLTTVNTPYFYDPLYNDGTPVASITDLNFLKKHIENTLGIDMSDYDVSLNNIYEKGHNLYRHTDIDESNTAKGYPVIVYVFGNDHKVRFDDNGGKRAFGQMVNPETLTLKNGDIYAFGMGGKGRFETVHDVVASPKTNNNFPELIGANGEPTKNYTVTFTFRRAADLEPGMPSTPAKISAVQQQGSDTKINIYAGTGENAELSNFALRPFTVNVELASGEKPFTFQSVEQGFHFYKTIAANNPVVAKKVLQTTNGAELKKLTSRANLPMTAEQATEWDNTSKSIMLNLMYDSYVQNPQDAQKLLATGNSEITHNGPYKEDKWTKGFPEVVMTVRDMLREESTQQQAPVTEPTDVPDGQTGEIVVEKEAEDRVITIGDNSFIIKPDGKIFFANGKDVTSKAIINIVIIRKEREDGTLRMSNFDNKNYYVLSDNRIIDSGKNTGDESVLDAATKKMILDKATLYKRSCNE